MSPALVITMLAGLAAQATAQSANPAPANALTKPQDPLHRDTPRSAVYSFLEACHAHSYGQAWRYIDLRHAAPDERTKAGPDLAQQLERILDRDIRFDVASLSGNPDGDRADGLPPDRDRVGTYSLDRRQVEIDLERVTLPSGLSVWVFASDSVAFIPQLARMVSDSPIERHLPQVLVDWSLVSTPLWRWIALALLALMLAPASRLVVRPMVLAGQVVVRRFAVPVEPAALEEFAQPVRWLLSIALFRAGEAAIAPSALLRLYLERAISFLFFVAVAQLCMAIVDVFIARLRRVLETRRQTFSYSALPLASRLLKIVIALLMAAATLGSWGYDTTTILAGLGVGGLAIALAAQKTIENLFGGVAVITDRPVAVGDFCKFGDHLGTVEDVGLRSTRIRTLDRTLVTVPNGAFSGMTLENFSRRDKMWFHLMLNLRRDTSADQVRTLLESITGLLHAQSKLELGALPVHFAGVGAYSLDLEVSAYVLTLDGDEFTRLQQNLLLGILDAVHAAGAALAMPELSAAK